MRYVKIKPDQTKYFSYLDPFGFLDHITLPGYFAIGRLEDDDDFKDLVTGLMICACTDDALVIEWLCIDPDFESGARGEGFILKAFDIAESLDKPELCALMSSKMELGNVCNNAKSFFTERLFDKEEALIGEWSATLDLIAKSKWFSSTAKLPETTALGEIKRSVLRSFLENIPEDGEKYQAPIMDDINLRKVDQHISHAIMDGDEICGLIMVQKAEDGLWPVFMYAESENETKALIKSACEEAIAELSKDTDVWVRVRSKEMGELLEKLVPKKIDDRYLLVAKVSEYQKLKELNS